MTEQNQFKIIFDYLEKDLKEQEKLQSEISSALKLNNEIKILSEIINEYIPTNEPLIYSSS